MRKSDNPSNSAITLRSVGVSALAVFVAAVIVQHVGVTDEWSLYIGNEPIGIPGVISFGALLLVSALVWLLTRIRLLTRAEMFCVLFCLLVATPLLAGSFWRNMLAISNTATRRTDFELYDALPSKLWPHGENLLCNAQASDGVVITNADGAGSACIRMRVPIIDDTHTTGIVVGRPYFISILAQTSDFDVDSKFYCAVDYGDGKKSGEIFSSVRTGRKTPLFPDGFFREGYYGHVFHASVHDGVVIEFGIQGKGRLVLKDPQLFDVSALESAFVGREVITESEFKRHPPAGTGADLIVKPDNLLSWKGVKFILVGYIPLRAWLNPLLVWSLLLGAVFCATFAMGVVFNRQWVRNERYPMPLMKIPSALLDCNEGAIFPRICKNKQMLAGLGLAFFWCLMRGLQTYNPGLPDMEISIPITQYLNQPFWGKTWGGVTFSVSGIAFGIGLLMELHILLSLVVGYLLCRFEVFAGDFFGLAKNAGYPYPEQQLSASYLTYAVLTLLLAWKYLARTIQQAFTGGDTESVNLRKALLLLFFSIAVLVGLARWMAISTWPCLVFFAAVLLFSLSALKLREECGLPGSSFIYGSVFLTLIPLLGGIGFFTPQGLLFMTFASLLIFSSSFLHLPGVQFEMGEIGNQMKVSFNQIFLCGLLGVILAVGIGGWVYLGSAYAIGADNYPIATGQFVGTGDFRAFTSEINAGLSDATPGIPPKSAVWNHATDGLLFGGAVTLVLTVLSRLFANFIFHPAGYILGFTPMMANAWGSLLLAWMIRFIILKVGGAATVRNKLVPFAIGILLGIAMAYAFFIVLNGYLYFAHPGVLKARLSF